MRRDESYNALIISSTRRSCIDVRDVAEPGSRAQTLRETQDASPLHCRGILSPERSRFSIAFIGTEKQRERRQCAVPTMFGTSTSDFGGNVPFRQIPGRLLPGLRLKACPTNAEALACRAGPPGLTQSANTPKRLTYRRRTDKKENVCVRMPAVLAVCCFERRDCPSKALSSFAVSTMLSPRTESLTLTV
ncbi:hypothetical protein NW837_10190 [Synechococcus sp. R6-10]